jgi:hypothetical protein
MENLLGKEMGLQEDIQERQPRDLLWDRWGPVLLLGAFAIFLFKYAPLYWPLTMTAFLGYVATSLWKKWGIFASLAALCLVTILILRLGVEPFWTLVLSSSIAVSWFLIYLGALQSQVLVEQNQQKMRGLEKERSQLEKQVREINLRRVEEQNQNVQLKMQIDGLMQSKADIQEEKIDLAQLQYQFALLREQFEDKSEALDLARKDLFKIENDFLLLQKTWEESNLAPSEEVLSLCRDIQVLEEECVEMQNQIFFFQDFISSLLECKNS